MVPSNNGAEAVAVKTHHRLAPRVIHQPTSVFLIATDGSMWRVYDSAAVHGADRKLPSRTSPLPVRLFVSLVRRSDVRALRIDAADSHGLDPELLQRQLDDSSAV